MSSSKFSGKESPPIFNLPPELLIYTFKILLPDNTLYYAELHILAQVCKTWHSIILSTPILWRYAIPTNRRILQRAIVLSHDAPLVIRTTRCSENDCLAFMRVVCPQMERWESVELHALNELGVNLFDFASFLSESAAPKLRDLTIQCSRFCEGDDRSEGCFDLFQGDAPALQRLALHCITMPWTSAMISGLVALQLSHQYDRGPTILQLRGILQSCPLLRQLKIGNTRVKYEGVTRSMDFIILDRLEELNLWKIGDLSTEHLLRHVIAPACVSFQCKTTVSGELSEQHLVPWIDAVVSGVFPKVNLVSFGRDLTNVVVSYMKDDLFVQPINCDPCDPRQFIEYLGSAAKQTCPTFPFEHLTLDGLSLLGAQQFLARLPHLSSLSLMRAPLSLEVLYDAQTIDGRAVWLLPQLRTLHATRLEEVMRSPGSSSPLSWKARARLGATWRWRRLSLGKGR